MARGEGADRARGPSSVSAGPGRSRPWGALLAGLALAAVAAAQASEPSATQLEFFESKVRPLLVTHCYECHSAGARKLKGGLRLDTRADFLRGGESGALLDAAEPARGRLLEALHYEGDPRMPPAGKLDAAALLVFEQWVRLGAPYPSDGAGAAGGPSGATHWAFQPIAEPAPPPVRDEGWCANPIDRFVLARLEAAGLRPSPRADRRTLLRRLSFDLIGLPPTAEELEHFEHERAPDAWSREIERLLASPHYGERWGRAWLDLARYSDSNGLDENLAMATAWRYRDWVVRALNADLPYDQFLTWQLAGDLLPEPPDEALLRDHLIATGFLVLGPKMLAEQDKQKLALDVVDEQSDVAFRVFQGITLGCARCHDHKFDPLSQRDYTAVAGIFHSTRTMGDLAFVSRWNERALAPLAKVEARASHEARLEQARVELNGLRTGAEERLRDGWIGEAHAYLLAADAAARASLVVEAEEASRGNLLRDDSTFGSKEVVIARSPGGGGLQFAEYDLSFDAPGRRTLEVRLAAEESRPLRVLLDGRTLFDAALAKPTGSWQVDGQRWYTVGPIDVHAGRNVLRLERDGPWPHVDRLLLWSPGDAPAELVPTLLRNFVLRLELAQRTNDPLFAPWASLTAATDAEFAAAAPAILARLRAEHGAQRLALLAPASALLDGPPPQSRRELAGRYQTLFSSVLAQWRELRAGAPATERLQGEGVEALRQVLLGPTGLFQLSAAETEPLLPAESRAALAVARAAVEELERTLPPLLDTAPAVAEAATIADLEFMRRGNPLEREDAVPRGVPPSLAPGLELEAMPADQSGRLQLARWMLDPRHPLTARVAVNRLWQGHFGLGLVASSSNFGLRGDPPSHPELLDWLAREFQRRGWSNKALHRLICASSTYQQASLEDPERAELDPSNRLLARQNRHRLDAESLRDALLAASGALELTLGGNLLEVGNGDYVTNDQSEDGARYDSLRRSLYLPIIRNAMFDLYSAFDYPDPGVTLEARPTTTSASQALYLMNSPLVLQASERLANGALAASGGAARVAFLYRAAYGRAPSPAELARALEFVTRLARPAAPAASAADVGAPAAPPLPPAEEAQRRERETWALLAQALLVSNEFLYVD